MNSDQYLLSFTSASLSLSESIKIAETYLELRDWEAVEEKVKSENLLQARTQSSVQRVYRELTPRLKRLSEEQLELLVEGTLQEQKQLLWFAVCKRYSFIQEFATEVVREKHLKLDFELKEFDYEAFFNRKADWHPELDNLAGTTRKRLRQMLFQMLRQAGLVSENNSILPAILSKRMIEVLAQDAPMSYQIFPVSDSEITRQ